MPPEGDDEVRRAQRDQRVHHPRRHRVGGAGGGIAGGAGGGAGGGTAGGVGGGAAGGGGSGGSGGSGGAGGGTVGTVYFVAPNGLDTNAGTMAAPFKTIQKGVTVGSAAASTVFVRAGTYNEKVSIVP